MPRDLYSGIVFGFLSAERQAEIMTDRAKHLKARAEAAGVDWDEDKTKFNKCLLLKGESWNPVRYQLFDVPPVKSPQLVKHGDLAKNKHVALSPSGNYCYANRILPAGYSLDLMQGQRHGMVAFSTDVVTPVLFDSSKGGRMLDVWMGLTPMEVLTQRQGVRRAKGHVLVGGLGLGWLLWKVAAKKSVKKVTVVEISQELLDWFGTELCELVARETGTEVEVICDDVLNHMGEHGEEVRHLIDIWPSYPNHLYYMPKEWQSAIERVKHFWGWGVIADPDDYVRW